MIQGFLDDMRYLMGIGGFLFIFGLLMQSAIPFVSGFFLIGLTYIIDVNTKKAYFNARKK